jgi:hypothetical protein
LSRSLPVIDDSGNPPIAEPMQVSIGARIISIEDTGNGRPGSVFVDWLVGAGATRVDSSDDAPPDARIVIRGAPSSPDARRHTEALEQTADVVLGSARPAFARVFASACARWVNS